MIRLLGGHQMVLLDFLGFSLSEKPRDHVYSLHWQADAVEELVRRAGSPPVVLVAHDMGTSVATELCARSARAEADDRRPECAAVQRQHPAEAADQWALVSHADGHRLLHRIIHYMSERERLAERWHDAFRDWPGHLSLAWGLQDPVATPVALGGLRELRPGIPVRELPQAGHYPQNFRIEDPAAMAELIARELDAR